jgi:hypothetical protein
LLFLSDKNLSGLGKDDSCSRPERFLPPVLYLYCSKISIMFKENPTEKLIGYIQSLPDTEKKRIAQRILQPKSSIKTKKTPKQKLSSAKNGVAKTRLQSKELEAFLLNAPIFTEKQIKAMVETRKAVNKWRVK